MRYSKTVAILWHQVHVAFLVCIFIHFKFGWIQVLVHRKQVRGLERQPGAVNPSGETRPDQQSPPAAVGPLNLHELIPIREAAARLHCSVWTIRRRVNTPGDPLRAARSRIGKQKPMHFLRSKLTLIEREASAA